jgi:hypothetical protein
MKPMMFKKGVAPTFGKKGEAAPFKPCKDCKSAAKCKAAGKCLAKK